jgi:hypothetical protein
MEQKKIANLALSEAEILKGASPLNGVIPPYNRRFGQPNGNKPSGGYWRKESTPRYKLEQMMKLKSSELEKIAKDDDAPLFERKIALAIAKGDWGQIERMINQVYGTPKQSIEVKQVNEYDSLSDEEIDKLLLKEAKKIKERKKKS